MNPLLHSHLTEINFNTTSELGISITTNMWKTEYLTSPDIVYFSFVYYYTETYMEFLRDWEPYHYLLWSKCFLWGFKMIDF